MDPTRTKTSPRGGVITAVAPGSLGAAAGLSVGDRLEAIDGQLLEDLIDFRFAAAEPEIEVAFWRDDQRRIVRIVKDPDADLGLSFADAVFDRVRQCANRCEFCFIHQMPGYPGSQAALRQVEVPLRRSLYIEDDDYRLSFLQGNFITMTNLSERDWRRIAAMHLAPLYISIHTTDPDLRAEILGQPLARKLHAQLDRLASLGIDFHGQIVLAPGRNDGAALDRTITESISRWHPHLLSLCIVPYGATAFRQTNHLAELPLPTPSWCASVIRQVRAHQRRFKREQGDPIVRLADEFYLQAGEPFPGVAHYASFSNLGDGIGGVRLLWHEWARLERKLPDRLDAPRSATIVTGLAAAPVLAPIVARLNLVENLDVRLLPLPSRFWGDAITVTGLLTGSDLEQGLKESAAERGQDASRPSTVWIPDIMLRPGSPTFLDDRTVLEISRATGEQLIVLPADARGLFTAAVEPERLADLGAERWYGSYYA